MEYLAFLISIPVIFTVCTLPGNILRHRAHFGECSYKVADYVSLAGIGVAISLIAGFASLL